MASTLEESPISTRRRGGFSMPRNPGLALQEAIQDERAIDGTGASAISIAATAEAAPPTQEVPTTPAADFSASPQMRNSAIPQASTFASEAASTPVIEEARKPASPPVRKVAGKQASTNGAVVSQDTNDAPSDSRMLQTVRDNLVAKRSHTGGVKTSVDMSPELSLRVKRYLLDHGNPAARILMIELVEAFLIEEGY